MAEPSLFDQPQPESVAATPPMAPGAVGPAAHPDTPKGNAPLAPEHASAGPKLRPIEYLIRTLEADQRRTATEVWHPREDRLWIAKERGQYVLSVRRGQAQYTIGPMALRQLGAQVNVSAELLGRLAPLQNVEDCRLLNMLLWAAGADRDWRLACTVRGGELASVQAASYTALDPLALAQQLGNAEQGGRLRLRRYDLTQGGLRLEIEHSDLPPIDLSPFLERSGQRADLWRPGAILVNLADQSHAATVVPALLRDWGGLALPLVPRAEAVVRRRHTGRSAHDLVATLVGDVGGTREAAFVDAAERLRQFHQRFLPGGAVDAYLDGLSLPLPSQAVRDAVCKLVTQGAGPATAYRLLATLLKVGRDIDGMHRRLRLDLAVGRLVWSRSSSKGAKGHVAGKPVPGRA